MRKLVKKLRKNIVFTLILSLLFNGVASLYVSASMVSHANDFADQDSVLICTGTSYKWMSLSVYEQTGKVKYIDPPENSPENLSDLNCTYGYLSDSKYHGFIFNNLGDLVRPADSNLSIRYFQALYPNAKHQLPLTRGPPSLS
ncbi:hypothetical protein [uncultured Paraglaciecola sp.]|uniref:hypothetical protein n=1 Tax=uncultured Paraglaciecola sp. TaxID=1765024 RepID=UPI002599195A|nr:hypothetical protein [uncultured Paraglaciecola sp.]